MRIEDLAHACGLDVATVETYRRAGLLPAPRTDRHGQPHYPPKISTTRVRFLSDAQTAGLGLDDLVEILTAADSGTQPHPQLRNLLDGHLGQLHQRISQLRRVETELRRIALRWPPTTHPLTSNSATDSAEDTGGVVTSGRPEPPDISQGWA